MQDTTQTQNQTAVNLADTQTHQTDSPAQQTDTKTENMAMVSIGIEKGPIEVEASDLTTSQEEAPVPEITPSQPEKIVIPHELSKVIEKSPDTEVPKIEEEVKAAEVTPAKESMPIINTPSGAVKLPMTYAQALVKERESKSLDSVHWLAAVILYLGAKYDPDAVKDAKHFLRHK